MRQSTYFGGERFVVRVSDRGGFFYKFAVIPFMLFFAIFLLVAAYVSVIPEGSVEYRRNVGGLNMSVLFLVVIVIYGVVLWRRLERDEPALEITREGVSAYQLFLKTTLRWDQIARVYISGNGSHVSKRTLHIVRAPRDWLDRFFHSRYEDALIVPLGCVDKDVPQIMLAMHRLGPATHPIRLEDEVTGARQRAPGSGRL
ncbi:MAG: hypothetical protein KDJ36_03335 [Hyphomicrobiaceae bacterium]|nr:hypothetical protein [Hyphomicrobiaceae bacterium]